MTDENPTQRLGFDPDPPVAGQDFKVTYDFDGIDVEIIEREVTITVGPGSTEIRTTVKRPDSPATVGTSDPQGMPSTASAAVASAEGSVDKSSPVTPPPN